MSSCQFKKRLLVSSIAMALSGSFATSLLAAEAEQSQQDSDDSEEETVIVITGIRDSLKANLSQKRHANSVIEAITAEDIGKFPDKNLAESLQRVPGVTINRGFAGEGNEVTIRGVDPQLTQTLVNGQFVASTSWFSLAFNRRSFNMDLMPSEIVSGIEVHKSPTASLDEGGVGGTVILKTRKPLEIEANKFFASAEVMKNSFESDTAPTVNGMYSWKNEQDNFGILAAYSRAETIGFGNKAENYWEEAWSASGISQFRQERVRDTFDINVQYAVNERLSFDLHYFESTLEADNTNQNFLLFGGCCSPTGGLSTFAAGSSSTVSPTTGIPMAGTLIGGGSNWVLAQDVNSRRPELKSDLVDFTVDYEGDSYKFHGSVGSTTASGGNGGNVNSLWGITGTDTRWLGNGGNVSVDFDMTLASGMFVNVNGLDLNDPNWQGNLAASLSETTLYDEEDWLQVDLEFDMEWEVVETIKVGMKARDHKFGKSQTNFTVDTNAILGANSTLGSSGFYSGGINVSGVMASGSDMVIAGVGSGFDSAVRSNITGATPLYAAFGDVEEEISAFYVQADFAGDYYRGNFGIRYVETDVTGSTFADGNDPTSRFSRTSNYSDVLPSFNLAYDLAEDTILRFSAAEVMSRPAYGTLNPALGGINPTSNVASSGNVAIDPFRANQFDAGIEWYFGDNNFIGAAIFYKDIESFVTSGTIQDLVFEPNGDQGAPNDLELYTLTVPIQGKGGHVQGIELNYQQLFGNFGFIGNVTISDSEGETDDGSKFDLPGNSELSYNLTGFYQVDDFEARLTYTFRDEYLAEGTAISGSLDVFEEQGYLDGGVTWHVNDYLDLSLEGINLLEETTIQRHGTGTLGTNRVTTENGARYYIKAAIRF
ncbi:TonB-dependent receptor [Aliikangiella coralliicola]|uniref:TonB-dependent receptor n=1 Tax=Aliikangiella coralliicola TaxID=2592383 RepID=A0A545UHH6_9GAMM|nr:TonB-dependent receptor [Aliikangiella coralliicola]TQV88926.1 TonB-dependent receptor [Aliikangiella coralliicola]